MEVITVIEPNTVHLYVLLLFLCPYNFPWSCNKWKTFFSKEKPHKTGSHQAPHDSTEVQLRGCDHRWILMHLKSIRDLGNAL